MIMANRRKLAIALAPLVLAACGGGGGGSNVRPTTYTPITGTTTSANLFGLSSNFIADVDLVGNPSSTPTLTARSGTVQGSATFTSLGQPTLVNLDVAITSGPSFTESFSGLTSGTLAGATNGTSNAVLWGENKTTTDVRTVLIMDPASIGLSYSTLGAWTYRSTPSATAYYGGNFIIGVRTSPGDIPSSGSATYSGVMVGTLSRRTNDIWAIGAQATATANFSPGSATVNFATTNTNLTSLTNLVQPPITPPTAAAYDLNGTLSYAAINNLTGTMNSAGGMTGTTNARFFGPAARELGGTFFISSGTSEQMSGAFALKR